MNGHEIRSRFLEYFKQHGHAVLPSSPLVPAGDPTLLFTNAGMVQFKDVFVGRSRIGSTRATTSQKCLRVSGKHNDFENVGRTPRHHTFFEMLGNFSFGDYFKREAIGFAWELLTREYGLDPDRLYPTVFEQDDEAAQLWVEVTGVAADRVLRMGEKDNFWAMGETGPCGPCSEILFDQGPEFGPDDPYVEGDRFLELWNLVFMQYQRDQPGGELLPLPAPSIDTGAGLERIAAVLQGKPSNYDSDLFLPIIEQIGRVSGKGYRSGEDEADVSQRVIADHARATTFLIGDGVLPSNEGRGYVLRRIMRRAARHGVLIGLNEPFLYQICGAVVDVMQPAYPELVERTSYIARVVKHEEQRFLCTLENGLKLLNEQIERLGSERVLDGELAFKLYDTFGFPLDLVEDIGRDKSFSVDKPGFEQAMAKQRQSSAKAWSGSGEQQVSSAYAELAAEAGPTQFVGYDNLVLEARVVGLIRDGQRVESARQGEEIEIVCDRTPFYAEMGGQVGDAGKIVGSGFLAEVRDAVYAAQGLVAHRAKLLRGEVKLGDSASLEVDRERRAAIQRNHTATHLLHHALQTVLGPDAKQAGSLVTPERLRFDFTHYAAIEPRELERIEIIANELILDDRLVSWETMPLDAALEAGVTALFGEKYGQSVRVLSVEGVSQELCGGTHARSTGEIGSLLITSESSVAAGVRRIEARTGLGALELSRRYRERVREAATLLKANEDELVERTERALGRIKGLEREIEKIQAQMASAGGSDIYDNVKDVNGIKLLAVKIDLDDPKGLRNFGTQVRDRLKSGVVVIGAESGGRALLLAMVTDDLTDRFNANDIIRAIAPAIDGSGGGRADMAQAGGKDPGGIEQALAAVEGLLR
ncbi:MAG: alanine--tRNA ligase [Candidatus Alcyoniella australis]|nr:alanine--tRNA ligase [Candidatus Alcyoniella australis]